MLILRRPIRFRHGIRITIEGSANLPDPDIIAAEIVEDLQAALAQFAEIAADLKRDYFAAGFFSSTSMSSIGPLPMFSGRCAPAGVKTASPFLPDISSLLPSG